MVHFQIKHLKTKKLKLNTIVQTVLFAQTEIFQELPTFRVIN